MRVKCSVGLIRCCEVFKTFNLIIKEVVCEEKDFKVDSGFKWEKLMLAP